MCVNGWGVNGCDAGMVCRMGMGWVRVVGVVVRRWSCSVGISVGKHRICSVVT